MLEARELLNRTEAWGARRGGALEEERGGREGGKEKRRKLFIPSSSTRCVSYFVQSVLHHTELLLHCNVLGLTGMHSAAGSREGGRGGSEGQGGRGVGKQGGREGKGGGRGLQIENR